MRRITLMLLMVMGLLTVFAAGAALAQEEPETPAVVKEPASGLVLRNLDNPCTENVKEGITFSGTWTIMHQKTADGRFRVTHIQGDEIVGTDTVTGEQYRLEEVRNITRNPPIRVPGPLPTDRTDSFTYRVYSLEGTAPLFVVHTTARITTTPDGEKVVDFRDTYTQCPGEGRVQPQ